MGAWARVHIPALMFLHRPLRAERMDQSACSSCDGAERALNSLAARRATSTPDSESWPELDLDSKLRPSAESLPRPESPSPAGSALVSESPVAGNQPGAGLARVLVAEAEEGGEEENLAAS